MDLHVKDNSCAAKTISISEGSSAVLQKLKPRLLLCLLLLIWGKSSIWPSVTFCFPDFCWVTMPNKVQESWEVKYKTVSASGGWHCNVKKDRKIVGHERGVLGVQLEDTLQTDWSSTGQMSPAPSHVVWDILGCVLLLQATFLVYMMALLKRKHHSQICLGENPHNHELGGGRHIIFQ